MNIAYLIKESALLTVISSQPQQEQALVDINADIDKNFDAWCINKDHQYFNFVDVNKDKVLTLQEVHQQFSSVNPFETWEDS